MAIVLGFKVKMSSEQVKNIGTKLKNCGKPVENKIWWNIAIIVLRQCQSNTFLRINKLRTFRNVMFLNNFVKYIGLFKYFDKNKRHAV